MAENIFKNNDGVINQPRKRQRQSAKNHHVDGAAAQRQRDERRERGQRNGKEHRHGGAQTAEKNQNHHAGQHETDQTFVDQIFNRVTHEDGLIKHHFGHEFFRHINQMRDRVIDAVHHRDGVRVAALFQHGQINRRLTVHAHDVILDLRTVHRVADIADEHRSIANGFQRHAVDVFQVVNLAVDVKVVIIRPDFHITGGQNQIRVVHRAHHVHHA